MVLIGSIFLEAKISTAFHSYSCTFLIMICYAKLCFTFRIIFPSIEPNRKPYTSLLILYSIHLPRSQKDLLSTMSSQPLFPKQRCFRTIHLIFSLLSSLMPKTLEGFRNSNPALLYLVAAIYISKNFDIFPRYFCLVRSCLQASRRTTRTALLTFCEGGKITFLKKDSHNEYPIEFKSLAFKYNL